MWTFISSRCPIRRKGHSTMGLPRASGKRRWSGEDGGEALPAAKVICTSPPHALCAEDVLHHPALTHAHATTPALECELTSGATGDPSTTRLEQEELPPGVPGSAPPCLPGHHAFPEESEDDDSDDDHDDFIDDEEDKDSGFIDSNSIDNSSDDEVENRGISGDAGESCSSTSSSSTTTTTTSTTTASTSLQLSLSKVLSPTSTSPQVTPSPAPTLTMSQVPILLPSPPLPLTVYTPTLSSVVTCTTIPLATTNTSPSSPVVVQAPITPPLVTGHTTTSSSPPPPPFSSFPSLPTTTFLLTSVSTTTTCTTTTATSTTGTSTEDPSPKTLPSEGSITTVTATQTSTVVTSTYQGALSSPVYEPHPFYPGESYPSRPSTPTWESCNYYDGSQPTTNKYMEISPNKSTSSQSIQCDENGKSYLELGSASPYTHTYSSDCGNYTTSPSSYPAQSYNQTYTSPSSYGQPSSYYGPRQSYSPGPYVYPTGENYTTFEGENGCSYNYTGNAYGSVRGSLLPSRGPPRCMSPYCDPTRSSPRPSCYHQQRLSVLNMSMYKLNRFRQFPDPSLHRSVLICNTLRHIERELEAEGVSVASLLAHSHGHPAHPHLQGTTLGPGSPPCPEPMPSSSPSPPAATETPLSSMHTPPVGSPLATPSTPPPSTPGTPPPATHYSTPVYPTPQYLPTDHASGSYDSRETVPVHMRAYPNLVANTSHEESREGPSGVTADTTEGESSPSTPAPRPTPGPQEERTDAINWCSVLSLSSQTDLDSMNNNEYGEWSNETGGDLDYNRPEDGPPWKLPSLSAEDVLKSFPEASKRLEANEDLDSIINVLVGS
ncbi:mucin-2-like isoform X3 [Portunus trituberculatus]|uniref:mucin-2-like isoform X3 n=1 Tax=Portunus trituberculatus TaxID=210409 RepID=UPI001E1CCBC0|nr:mucin-2-like isoform X3 [Portunus trituberculatus]